MASGTNNQKNGKKLAEEQEEAGQRLREGMI